MKAFMPVAAEQGMTCRNHPERSATVVQYDAAAIWPASTGVMLSRTPMECTGAYCSQECAEDARFAAELPAAFARLGAEEKQ